MIACGHIQTEDPSVPETLRGLYQAGKLTSVEVSGRPQYVEVFSRSRDNPLAKHFHIEFYTPDYTSRSPKLTATSAEVIGILDKLAGLPVQVEVKGRYAFPTGHAPNQGLLRLGERKVAPGGVSVEPIGARFKVNIPVSPTTAEETELSVTRKEGLTYVELIFNVVDKIDRHYPARLAQLLQKQFDWFVPGGVSDAS